MRPVVLCLALAAVACGPRQRPVDPLLLRPPAPRNNGIMTAATLTLREPAQGILTCDGRVYHRLDGLSEGQRVTVRLRVETGSPYRFCHHAAFPDAHDQYTYTDLRGCAGDNAPSDVSAEAVADGPTMYIRVWRDGPNDPACIAARYTLRVE